MSSEGRASTIAKLAKVANKNFSAVKPPANRGVLENLLYACLLENSDFSPADEAFAKLEQYCDWNEVRVSTVAELAEVVASLNRPEQAAERLKNALHSVFETHYSYDLDFLIKESQGKAVAQLEKYFGVSPFAVAYVVQNSFGGHRIPLCDCSLELAFALGLATAKERENANVPGLERAISKTKGVEFFSTFHQLGVAYDKSPYSPEIKKILTDIAPDAAERMKKRPSKSKADSSEAESDSGANSKNTKAKSAKGATAKQAEVGSVAKAETKADKSDSKNSSGKPSQAKGDNSSAETGKKTSKPAKKPANEKSDVKKVSTDAKKASAKPTTKKPLTKKPAPSKPAPSKPATKRPAAKPSDVKSNRAKPSGTKSSTKKPSSKLSKKKPR